MKKKPSFLKIKETLELMEDALNELQKENNNVIIASRKDMITIFVDGKLKSEEFKHIIDEVKKRFPISEFHIEEIIKYKKTKLDDNDKEIVTYIYFDLN